MQGTGCDSATVFTREFGRKPLAFESAHGRVNLIGEHTDYNQGFVLPMLIAKQCHAAGDLGGEPGHCEVYSREAGEMKTFRIGDEKMHRRGWASYVAGVLAQLHEQSAVSVGVRIAVASDVPMGAGLSSSAALEIAVGRLVCRLLGRTIEPMRLARMCQQAEHRFVGVPCGLMDQAVVSSGRSGYAMMLDCREAGLTEVKLPSEFRLAVVHTGVKHDLAEGAYKSRVEECRAAAHALSLMTLRDATLNMLSHIDDSTIRKRAAHVIGENQRVIDAVAALESGSLEQFGRLMYDSHDSLRDDYQVSCRESDRLVCLARSTPEVWGARMTGGGFGGCVIALGTREGLRRYCDRAASLGATPIERIGAECS